MEVDSQAIAELIPIAFLITVANGLVLFLFAQRKHLRTAPNYILLSLAICDIGSGIINIPLFILVAFTSVLRSTQSHSYFVILISVLNNTSAVSTYYHILVAISEKYMYTVFPVKHRRITTKTTATVLGVVWTWSNIVCPLPLPRGPTCKTQMHNPSLTWYTLYFVSSLYSCFHIRSWFTLLWLCSSEFPNLEKTPRAKLPPNLRCADKLRSRKGALFFSFPWQRFISFLGYHGIFWCFCSRSGPTRNDSRYRRMCLCLWDILPPSPTLVCLPFSEGISNLP